MGAHAHCYLSWTNWHVQMLSTSQSEGMSGLVQVVQGALEPWLWTSDKAAVKTIKAHSGYWLPKVCKSEVATGGQMCGVTHQRLFSLWLLLQGRSEGENENLSTWQLFPFAHILVLEHRPASIWGEKTYRKIFPLFQTYNNKYVLNG